LSAKSNLDSVDINESDYKGYDLFAFARAYETPQAFEVGRPTTEAEFEVFGTSKTQWAFRYSDVKFLIDPLLKEFYPEQMEEMLQWGRSADDASKSAKDWVKESLNQQ